MTTTRVRRAGQLSAVIIISVLLLAASVSCTAAGSQSSEQPTATVSEQEVAAATITPPPTDTTEAPIATETAEAPTPTETAEAAIPAGWMTHTNQGCAYRISYPAEMEVNVQDESSLLLAYKLDSPGAGPLNFVYVSVVDQNSPATGEIIYNYDPAESETLLNMQVGESKASRDVADVSEWFTYERKPDTPIGDQVAQTYENAQPWEFPAGTKEIRYYLSLNGCIYLIGGYLDTTGSGQAGAINEALFNEIMATVQVP